MAFEGGSVRYERVIKTGDFENKKLACELHFTEPEDLDIAFDLAIEKVHTRLEIKKPVGKNVIEAEFTELKRGPGRPPNTTKADELKKSYAMNKTKTVVPLKKEEITLEEPGKRNESVNEKVKETEARFIPVEQQVTEDIVLAELDEFAAAPETAVATTDKDLYAACTAKQKATNNPIAIRQLIGQYVKAPKGVKDIPAEHRSAFLEKLAAL